jgi:prevent-host-death family protein
MITVGVHEAKTHLSRLLRQVALGEQITIERGGVPVARIVPVASRDERILGEDAGVYDVPDDFDEPLPDELLRAFGA